MENNNTNSQNLNENNAQGRSLPIFMLLCAYYILACIYLPLSTLVGLGDWFAAASALGVCVLACVALSKIAGSFKPFVFYAITVAIFALLGGSFLPISLIVAFVSGTCVYAYLVNRWASPLVWIIPAIPPIICSLAVGKALGAALSLITLPAALLLAYAVRKKRSRVSAVCMISSGICAMLVLLIGIAVYKYTGDISIAAIKSSIEAARAYLTAVFESVMTEMTSLIGSTMSLIDTEAMPSLMVGVLFNLLPAIIITASNILAYIIHSLYISANYSMSQEKHKEAIPMLTFDMSAVSAVVYIAALILSLTLTSGNAAIYGTAAQNILLILAPGLVMTALAGVHMLSMRKGPSCLGTLLYLALIFMIATLSPIVILAVALGGAILIIASHISRAKHSADK